ncbi:MAG TPA: VOC family protein [Flavihumibacter sp.]|nr:VOC family protein [Flavihumibacter sp.]
MERLQFTTEIDAPVSLVEEAMLGKFSYPLWTAAFNGTSTYEGGWNKGDTIKFIGVNKEGKKEGLAGTIKERIPGELVEIQYYGLLDGDTIITEGAAVEDWSGLEIYRFAAVNGKTTLTVLLDVNEQYKDYFNKSWPEALAILKQYTEQKAIHRPYPCFWFNGEKKAQEAAEMYCALFAGSSLRSSGSLVTHFEIGGLPVMLLDAGPMFRPNPTISLYATFEKKEEIDRAWSAFAAEGKVLMPLQQYEWSSYYGWVEDRFGINWQLTLGKIADVGQQVVPLLMFCGAQQNKAEAAIDYYTHVFRDAEKLFDMRYQPGQAKTNATIVHARYRLGNTLFMAMDSGVPQPFSFNQGVSLVISCDTQAEIDYYWQEFSSKGEESQCGWCADQFGVWWQVVPTILGELMADPATSQAVMNAFMKMKKFDIDVLLRAANRK